MNCNIRCVSSASNHRRRNEGTRRQDIILCRSFTEDNGVILEFYAASSDNSLLTFRDKISVPTSRIKNLVSFKDGTDKLSRNVGKQLPLLVA
jgi:hypothetical protein